MFYRLLKSAKEKKNNKLKSKKQTVESRKHLANYRVIQRNLVYVTNVALDIAKEEVTIFLNTLFGIFLLLFF